MKRQLLGLLSLTLIAFGYSCSKDLRNNENMSNFGEFSINLEASNKTNSQKTESESAEVKSNSTVISTDDFTLQVKTLNQTILKTWARFADAPSSIRFETGRYLFCAHYGDSTAQGFDAASYSGAAPFEVKYKEVSKVDIVCHYNKALVSIEPAVGFDSYYKDYKVELSTFGNLPIMFNKGEVRPAFFIPMDIDGRVIITRKDNSKIEAVIPTIKGIKAADHIILRIDNSTGAGAVQITVLIAETDKVLIKKDIELKAVSGKAPYFSGKGFNALNPNLMLPEAVATETRLVLLTGAVLEECRLTVRSSYLIGQGLPSSIDMTKIDSDVALQNKFKALGITWTPNMKGSTISEIDFSGMIQKLPALEYKSQEHFVTVEVKDAVGRVGELPLKFIVLPPYLEITEIKEVVKNGTTVDFSFAAMAHNTTFERLSRVSCQIDGVYYDIASDKYSVTYPNVADKSKAVIKITGVNAINQSRYFVRIANVNPGSKERYSEPKAIYIQSPKFDLELNSVTDKQMTVTVKGSDLHEIGSAQFDPNLLVLKYNNQGTWEDLVPTSSSYDDATKTKTFVLTGLIPSEQLRIKSIYNNMFESKLDLYAETYPFNFNVNWRELFTISGLQQGGKYGGGWFGSTKTDKVNLTVNDYPTDPIWSTTNSLTANQSANPANTWTIIQSAFEEANGKSGKGVMVRSVAYSHNNVSIGDNVGSLVGSATGKGDVAPPSFPMEQCIPGKFSANMPLRSRPISVAGFFKYSSYESEKGKISVTVYGVNSDNQEVIVGAGTTVLDEQTSWATFECEIFYNSTLKATRMTIVCQSSESESGVKLNFDRQKCYAEGSKLYVDEIKLTY